MAFRQPEGVTLPEIPQAIVNNLWVCYKSRDTKAFVSIMNANIHCLAKSKTAPVYLLYNKEAAGIYATWPELVKAKAPIKGEHLFNKAETLEAAIKLADQ